MRGNLHLRFKASLVTGFAPAFPLAGKVSAELTDGGGAEDTELEELALFSEISAFPAPPPSVASGDTFPARGKASAPPP